MTVTAATKCIRCSYTLSGLAAAGVCPECGCRIDESLHPYLLALAPRSHLRVMRRGLGWIVAGLLILAAGEVGPWVAPGAALGGGVTGYLAMVFAPALVGAALMVVGYWLFTSPEHQSPGLPAPIDARLLLRSSAFVQLAAIGVALGLVVVKIWSLGENTWLQVAQFAVFALGGLVWIVQYAAALAYTGWLAKRVPDTRLAGLTSFLVPILPVLYIFARIGFQPAAGVVVLVFAWVLWRLRRHLVRLERSMTSNA
jgi:hypothetical protein